MFLLGYWLFHCHIEFHVEIGMALVFKFGDDSQMPPVPKNFPKCGNYLPENDIPYQSVFHLPHWLQSLISTSGANKLLSSSYIFLTLHVFLLKLR